MAAHRTEHCYWVYILASKPNGTIYVGVTNALERRVWQHRNGTFEGFTSRYGLKLLVHCEQFTDIRLAIAREKEVKGWLRAKKVALIRRENPLWRDLAADWFPAEDPTGTRSESAPRKS